MIALPEKFSAENLKDENTPSIIVDLQEDILEAEKTLQADWAANTDENQVDYTPPLPTAGDVILEFPDTWDSGLTDASAGRGEHTAIEYSGKMYVFGGYSGGWTNHVREYDIAGDSWANKTSGATNRGGHSAIEYGGKMYVFGGYTGAVRLNDIRIYDIAGDSWSSGMSGATNRSDHSAIEYGGKMYIYGGFTTGNLNTLWEYDIAGDSWTQLTSGGGSNGRRDHVAIIYDGKMYVHGGADATGELNTLWEYDIAGDSWFELTSGGVARLGHSAIEYDGKMYIFGGTDASTIITNPYWYDIETDSWAQLTDGSTLRDGHSAIEYQGLMYLFGGWNISIYTKDVWSHDMGYRSTGYITTNNFNLGEVPATTGEWVIEDLSPNDTSLNYEAWYSTTGAFGGEEVSVGAIVDGQTITDKQRYWRVKTTLTSNADRSKTPTLQSIIADFTNHVTYSNNSDLGFEVAIKSISGLTTTIDTFKASTISQMTVTFEHSATLSAWLATKHPKNKDVIIYVGFRAEGWSKEDYLQIFRGQTDSWDLNNKGLIAVNVKDYQKEWAVDVPLDPGDLPLTYTAEHHTDIMLDLLRNQINVRDSKIDLNSFADVKADLSGWKVTRSIATDQEDGKTLMEELRVLTSSFFIPNADGSIRIKRFDSTEVEIDSLTDDDFIDPPKWNANAKELKNRTLIYLAWDGDGDKASDFADADISANVTSQTNWSEIATHQLKDKWTQTAEKATQITNGVASDILDRYAEPPVTLDVIVDSKKIAYELGDIVKVTTIHAPSTDGNGIADVNFQIVNKNLDFVKDRIKLKLLEV